MKKFIFGLIILMGIVFLAICLSGEKESESVEPQSEVPAKKLLDNPGLRHVANMVWQLGMENAVDVHDSSTLNQWQEQCENAMIEYYDSMHPNEDLKDYKKVEAVLGDMEKIIPEGITTIDMINHCLMDYSMQMFRMTAYTKRVQQTDSGFVHELQAWSELESHLIEFCMDAAESVWVGGSACSLMMGAARNSVIKARVRDLQRILQLDGSSDPASDQMVNSKKDEFLRAIAKAPIKANDSLFVAMDQWVASRERYKGSTAVAFDDMSEAVWYSFSLEDMQDEEEGLEEDGSMKSLNTIRFHDFKERDWVNNGYIRELRTFIDDYRQGKIKADTTLIELLDEKELGGKFVIGHVEPFIGGGLFIQIMFLDHPQDIYSAWVYSFVDEIREVVTGYECRMLKKEKEKSGYETKQELLEELLLDPVNKLW